VQWQAYLADGASAGECAQLRRCTYTGRPLGSPEFVADLERSTLRLLAPRKGGRPKKPSADTDQRSLNFVA
jgi:hypothetical protein